MGDRWWCLWDGEEHEHAGDFPPMGPSAIGLTSGGQPVVFIADVSRSEPNDWMFLADAKALASVLRAAGWTVTEPGGSDG